MGFRNIVCEAALQKPCQRSERQDVEGEERNLHMSTTYKELFKLKHEQMNHSTEKQAKATPMPASNSRAFGNQAHEKVLNVRLHKGTADRSNDETSPHTTQDTDCPKHSKVYLYR